MTFEEQVTQFIERHRLIHRGMRIVAGVSGGADSMALLCFLHSRRTEWDLQLAVCSVDHRLRGAASTQDVRFVSDYCRKRGIPFYPRSADVAGYCRNHHVGIEAGARLLRYQAFAEVMQLFRADALALAHHGDDQIETMLMRETRGSAGPARAGIPVSRTFAGGRLIRPFLCQTKKDLTDYCERNGIQPRTDATNCSDSHTRNRFRNSVLPFLKKENPLVHLKFQYESERITEDERFLGELAEKALKTVILQKEPELVKISTSALLSVSLPLQRRMIHLILNYLYTSRQMPPLHQTIHIENFMKLIRSDRASGELCFPGGLSARKSYTFCVMGFLRQKDDSEYDRLIRLPGTTAFPRGFIKAGPVPADFSRTAAGPDCLVIDPDNMVLPLRIRNWRSGDRIRPNGLVHAQKVGRIFINEKVARDQRTGWPVVADGDGRIIWLPLLRRAINFPPETAILKKTCLMLVIQPSEDFGRIQE
ncbi:tRNA lysidine(34) synthetase TilS [Sporolactobacillus vineae]|uniref:tRNA lysidine(34) synthetase TilS n=1 Tax=Sporolactobacillus vineae TaxID=444463 RepID=UPI000289F5AB|nr:tRNA lysidine(34) synthetase TilS [Sporolactobacillus vineae]